jgi:uncharacterized phosphosugar-binding protein
MLIERYQSAVFELLNKAKETQKDAVKKAARIIATAAESGKKIYLSGICHNIEKDLIYRGGGPIFYKEYEAEKTELHEGDVLVVSSVSGRTKAVVDLTYDSVAKGINVIAFTSMEYATQVDPVHESGKKLYEMATAVIDNCAPAAEAMLDVDGIEAKFAAASGIASDFLMWSITSEVVEMMLADGYTPGILKSANFPGGNDYNKTVIEPHYDEFGY